jgi:translation initiation factor 6
MRVAQADFSGDRNLGLHAKSSDKFCLVGSLVTEKDAEVLEKVLKVKIVRASIFNTEFVSIFSAFNSNGIVLPKLVFDSELKSIKTLAKKFDMNVSVLKTKYTAVGNLILCNDNGCVTSNLIPNSDRKNIEDCLGAEVTSSTVAELDNVGSCGLATNKGCIIHRDASEDEIKIIGDALKVPVDIGTANFGSPFIGGCIVANSNGVVMGNQTTGPEIARIMETLQLV